MSASASQDRYQARILIIDDSPEEHALLGQWLRQQRYGVLAAFDGQQGYRRALAAAPDLVLLDAQMPVQDGCATCRLLKGDPATAAIPVLLRGAIGTASERAAALEAGATDYLLKTASADDLLVRICIHLDLALRSRAPAAPAPRRRDERIVAAALRAISEQLATPLTLGELARSAATYEKKLSHVFREATGMTVFAYIGEARMARSRQLLAETDISVQEVAGRSGFHNPGNFATAFRERIGMTPSAYRRATQEPQRSRA